MDYNSSSHDDGELSDDNSDRLQASSKNAGSESEDASSIHKSKNKNDSRINEEKEAEIRSKLLTKYKHQHKDEDDDEMFTIQPSDAQRAKDLLIKKELDKERERELEKRKAQAKRERDDRLQRAREPDLRRKDTRGRHDRHEEHDRERQKRHEGRRKHEERRAVSHYEKEKEKDRDRTKRKDKTDRHPYKRKHSSSSEGDRERIREEKKKQRTPETVVKKPTKIVVVEEKMADVEIQDVSDAGSKNARDEPVALEETIIIREEEKITSFTLDSPAGPKKYSKFESSPEPDMITPIHSDIEESSGRSEVISDEDEPDHEDVPEKELPFDTENARWENINEDQRSMLPPETKKKLEDEYQARLVSQLPVFYPGFMGCRNVAEYECVNKVEEGTFGVVYRAKNKRTDEMVALKKLKMEKEREGFPITSLREINMLLKAGNHPNIVNVIEVLIGSNMDKIYVAMEFVEHDMKSLMDTMHRKNKFFTIGQQKTLMRQLLSGLEHMHKLWILHRDLKTSNLLLSHKGILKIADFGLAREFGNPLKPFTAIVVTLWYRSPELLLGQKLYSTPIDLWSVGCIMAEFILLKPLFMGRGEVEQIKKIFLELGTPTETLWEGVSELPGMKQGAGSYGNYTYNQLRKKFKSSVLNETGFKLLNRLLTYCPKLRITAEEALKHEWFSFSEDPKPVPPEMFPTFPAKSEQNKAPPPSEKPRDSRKVEVLNPETAKLLKELKVKPEHVGVGGFSLKFDKARF